MRRNAFLALLSAAEFGPESFEGWGWKTPGTAAICQGTQC